MFVYCVQTLCDVCVTGHLLVSPSSKEICVGFQKDALTPPKKKGMCVHRMKDLIPQAYIRHIKTTAGTHFAACLICRIFDIWV